MSSHYSALNLITRASKCATYRPSSPTSKTPCLVSTPGFLCSPPVIAQCETDPTLPSLSMALPRPRTPLHPAGSEKTLLPTEAWSRMPRRTSPSLPSLVSAEADALASPLLWLFWFCFVPVLLVVLSWFEKIGVP